MSECKANDFSCRGGDTPPFTLLLLLFLWMKGCEITDKVDDLDAKVAKSREIYVTNTVAAPIFVTNTTTVPLLPWPTNILWPRGVILTTNAEASVTNNHRTP